VESYLRFKILEAVFRRQYAAVGDKERPPANCAGIWLKYRIFRPSRAESNLLRKAEMVPVEPYTAEEMFRRE
jgi:hypothetical protein